MRKILIILIIFQLGLISCSNDLDLLAPQEPVPVICFRMDPSDSLFYLTLTHTFSGSGNALDMAKDTQKVYYENANIRLESWMGNYKVDEIRFTPANRTKVPGLFPEVPGYCYQAFNRLSMINDEDMVGRANTFRLVVDVNGKLGPVNATLPMVPFPVAQVEQRWNKIFDLYPPDSGHYNVDFVIDHDYIRHCELLCRFRYQELSGTWTNRSANFILKRDMMIVRIGPTYHAMSTIYPEQFYNKLVANIKPINDTVIRRFFSMDLIFIAGDQWYKDYSENWINAGDRDVPLSGNINNGYGLFTMIRSVKNKYMTVSRRTLDSLSDGQYTKGLGFKKW